MEIIKNLDPEKYDILLRGKFTFGDHAEFREILKEIGELKVKQIVLHMARVDFIDSAALGMLLLASDEAEKHQKRLIIHGAAGQVKKMFEMARFDTLFTLAE